MWWQQSDQIYQLKLTESEGEDDEGLFSQPAN